MKYVDALVEKGYIEVSRGKYPVLEMANEGERAIIRIQADVVHFNKTGEHRSSVNRDQGSGNRAPAQREEKSGPMFSNKPSLRSEAKGTREEARGESQRTGKREEKSGPMFGNSKAKGEVAKKRETRRRIDFGDIDKRFGLDSEQESLTGGQTEEVVTDASQRPELYEKLRAMRNRIAKDMNVQPYQIFNNFTLQDLTVKAPSDFNELERIKGIGPQKSQQWGKVFLAVIAEWRA